MTQPSANPVPDTAALDLPATLDAAAAAGLIERINKMSDTSEIRFNAAAVTAISPGYLQILVSAFKTFPLLCVVDASPEFADAFAGCGVAYPQSPAAPQQIAEPIVEPIAKSAVSQSAPATASETLAQPTAEAAPEIMTGPERIAEPEPIAEPEAKAEKAPTKKSAAAAPAVVKTILTIDDSRTMRDMLNMALSGAGFTVVQAVDGQDGLKALARQPVDLIITDINMPKLDGYGVIRAVRSDPAYDDTPILVLSTEAEQESKDIAKDAGATGWIVKPFDPAGLVNIVNSVCG